jgi:dephospho-CoA kinase
MRLGLTGSIACGKSLADDFFREQGLPVLDADQLVHELQEPDGVLAAVIQKEFGPEFLNQDGSVNRQKLGKLVYSNQESLQRLNSVSQPVIRKAISQAIAASPAPLAIFDIPLLFEQDYQGFFDKTLVIAAPFQVQLKRLVKRDGLSIEAAKKRIASQMPLAEKVKRADYVVQNDGDAAIFRKRLAEFLSELE